MDEHAFFLQLERDARSFLKWYANKLKANGARYPRKQRLIHWRAYYAQWAKEEAQEAADAIKSKGYVVSR